MAELQSSPCMNIPGLMLIMQGLKGSFACKIYFLNLQYYIEQIFLIFKALHWPRVRGLPALQSMRCDGSVSGSVKRR